MARTTPIEECARPIDGVTLFYTDLDRSHVRISEIEKMARKAVDSNELFIDGLEIPVEDRIGEEGKGFKYLLHGLNPERILVAASALGAGGDGAASARRDYAKERVVFGRPIGKNQAIQHPLAECWMRLQAAELLMWKAAALYDAGKPCGVEANGGQVPRGGGRLRDGVAGGAHARRIRLRQGVPRRARLARGVLSLLAPVAQELALCYRRRAGARIAEVVLTGATQDNRIKGVAEPTPTDQLVTVHKPPALESATWASSTCWARAEGWASLTAAGQVRAMRLA